MLSRLFGQSSSSANDRIQIIDAATVRRWWEEGSIVLVDVREPDEHAAERIEGAVNLPLSSFDPASVPVPPEGKRLVIHCRSGVRCGTASERLASAGWTGDIHRLQGGILGWKACGGPTRTGR